MSIIEKYIQQTKDQNGNVVGFSFKGNIQNFIQEVKELEAKTKCNNTKLTSELMTENKILKEKIEALVRVNERLSNKISELTLKDGERCR